MFIEHTFDNSRPSRSRCKSLWRGLGALIAVLITIFVSASSCCAQTYTVADIGYLQPGSFSINTGVTPPTYSTSGSGTGYDYKMSFARTVVSGNVEMRGRIVSQSETASGAYTGLMMRESDISQSSGMGTIGVTVGGNVYFAYRPKNGDSVTTVTGPAVTLPLYVRLVKNGDTISGYYSQSDPENFTLLGSYTSANIMPNLFYVGFVSLSTTANLNTGVMDYVSLMTSLPQQSSNLKLWLRNDVGITSSASAISSWADQSGNAHDATQSTAGLKPTLVTGVLNSGVQPAVAFSGSQYLNLAANYADLNNAVSIFAVLKPSSASLTGNPVSFANASNTDAVFAQTIGTQASLSSYASATSSTVTTTTNPLSTSQYKLLEETLVPGTTAGTGVGTIYVNGVQVIQSTTMQNPANTTRNNCFVGAGVGPANIFSGNIAEILVYNNVSTAQRGMIESYILSKYAIGTAPTLDAPVFSLPNALVAPGQTLTLSQDQGSTVYFTTDGTVPSATSQWQGINPIPLNKTQTIKAIAIAQNFGNSPVASSIFTVDPATSGVPRSGLNLWLRSDLGVTASSGSVLEWDDVSGSGNNATQSVSGNRPTFTANSINGLPAITFGSSQFLQIPAGMADFTGGASIFVALKPTSVTAGARILDFGNGTASNNLQLQEPSTNGAALYVYNGTSSNVTASSALTPNQFQVLEAVHNGAASGTIYTNALQQAQNTLNNLANVKRSNNFIGQASGGGNNYIGQIAELLLFNRGLTASERAAVEAYLINRNQILTVNSPPAPVFSIGTSTLAAPSTVAIEGPADSVFFFTLDGTTPSPSTSAIYIGPINIIYTQTLKAVAVNKGVQSAVTSATYTLDATNYPAPSSTSTPLQLDLQLPNQSIPQDNNQR